MQEPEKGLESALLEQARPLPHVQYEPPWEPYWWGKQEAPGNGKWAERASEGAVQEAGLVVMGTVTKFNS